VGTYANQIHDYNPGIAPNGVFWTIPISDHAIDVNPGKGSARLAARDVAIPDYGDFVNSLLPGPSEPAVVSFDVRWFDPQSRRNAKEDAEGFAGEFVVTKASIEWSSHQAGFRFQSDPASASIPIYALVGNERNGVFF
jgi:hypothetical protein